MRRFIATLLWLGAMSVFLASAAWGGGLMLYEIGTPDIGTAAAGRVALADDASTALLNPAGMTRLQRSEMLVGLQPFVIDFRFSRDASTKLSPQGVPTGGDGGNAAGLVPALSLFYVHSVGPDLKVGLSAASYVGLGLSYDDDWVGRYYAQEASLITFAVNPTAAYRLADWLSIGAGPVAMYGRLKQRAAVNNAFVERDPTFPDGSLDFEDDTFGVGGNIGLFSEPTKGTRFGLQYFTPVDLDFEDSKIASGLGPRLTSLLRASGATSRKVNVDLTVPQMLLVSGYYQVTDEFALMANFGWQEWSQFGKPDIGLESDQSHEFTVDLKYDDTFHGALGVHYRVTQPWLLMAGFAYDSSPMTSAQRSPSLPMDEALRVAVGARREITKELTIGSRLEFIDLGSNRIDQEQLLRGTVHGDYSSHYAYVFGLDAAFRF